MKRDKSTTGARSSVKPGMQPTHLGCGTGRSGRKCMRSPLLTRKTSYR
ncbi:hypothetical protein ACFPM0_25435 [Pseudonocardia sulfidoxydans]